VKKANGMQKVDQSKVAIGTPLDVVIKLREAPEIPGGAGTAAQRSHFLWIPRKRQKLKAVKICPMLQNTGTLKSSCIAAEKGELSRRRRRGDTRTLKHGGPPVSRGGATN